MWTSRSAKQAVASIVMAGLLSGLAGCQEPQRKLVTFPPGTLPVQYEAASAPTACLVASVTMATNYVLGERRFTEPGLRAALARQKLDEKRVGDLKTYLAEQGLEMVVVTGRPDEKPPLGLRYWLLTRGYPVICVINRQGADPDLEKPAGPQYNHAVVVTGFSANPDQPSTDIVYYLDPSTADPLQSVGWAEFEKLWARAGHAMMVVVKPPVPSSGSSR
ncbi:MAG TPA: hypothetical protein PL151_14425 [Phycisphaerae bacterium]|nr:hypothetical protein [Phycisphaerae bacterium]HOJ76359.1 hypothetical protein [Phycisphaerae bacterium]HOM53700.1 hypothetical protein [Phycisphaerae bacterium]HON68569.1 hypothetical protein [Phycisphaerae bacterium]HOQ88204.1 hypothetical protein [Phycisphaerae bacterium]